MDPALRPTMQQIAQRAGVSRMAVSLALRGSPKVSAKTTERIRTIAEELGYRPNPLVSALMTQLRLARPSQRPTAIAYVTAFPTREGWRRSSQLLQFFEGARSRCETLGYKLEEWWLSEPGMTPQRVGEILFTRGIHGVLIAPLPAGTSSVHFDWSTFSGATIGYSFSGAPIHRASHDPFGAVQLALRELAGHGYRRIGLALAQEEDDQVERRWSAAMLVHLEGVAPGERVPILRAERWEPDVFAEWFRAHRPDAVLSPARECLSWLEAMGAAVPDEVGFVHLGVAATDAGIAGVDENYPLVGATAVDLVDTQLRRNEHGVPADRKTVLISGRWVPGRTLRDQEKRRK